MFNRECRKFHFSFTLAVFIGLALTFTSCSSEAGKQKHLARGEEYLAGRKYLEAVMEFRAAAEVDKNSGEAHWGLARAHENLGQISETIDELRRVVELKPENLDAKAKLGNYFLLTVPPQVAETQKILDEIFAVNPNFIEGHILKASLLAAQNKPEKEILDVLNHAIELDPQRIESHLSLARFFMKLNRGEDAEKTIQKAITVNDKSPLGYLEYGRFLSFANRAAEAEAKFKKAVEVAPDNLEARQAIADFYLEQRQLDKAEQAYKDFAAAQGNTPEGRLALAGFYGGVKREDDAIEVLQDILTGTPEFARARYRLSEIYLDRREFDKVGEQVEKLLSVNNTDAEALMLRARVKIEENNTEEAVKDLEEILKKQPSLKSALFYMAEARLALGQVEQARAFIGDLKKYHPNYLNSQLLEIQASFTANETDKALQQANDLLTKTGSVYPNAETSAQQLEELRFRALIARGSAYLDLGKLAEARADFQTIQKLSPNSATVYINLAKVAAAGKNQAEAVSFYEKALSIDGKNFDALNGLINVFKRQKQFGAAHARIDKTIAETGEAQKADLPALHFLKAGVFQAEKNPSAAEVELQKAMELDENYLPAYSAYAALLIEQNQSDRAIEQYKRIVERKQSASVYTLIGMLEDARQNFDEAEKNYRKALEIAPDSPIAANNLAWNIAAYERGNLDEALSLAQSSVNKIPGNAGFYDTLGWVYFKKGLYPQAVEQTKKAVALDAAEAARAGTSENPAYRLRLGTILASAGDKPNARKEVEIALKNEKDLSEKEVADAKNLLSSL